MAVRHCVVHVTIGADYVRIVPADKFSQELSGRGLVCTVIQQLNPGMAHGLKCELRGAIPAATAVLHAHGSAQSGGVQQTNHFVNLFWVYFHTGSVFKKGEQHFPWNGGTFFGNAIVFHAVTRLTIVLTSIC